MKNLTNYKLINVYHLNGQRFEQYYNALTNDLLTLKK